MSSADAPSPLLARVHERFDTTDEVVTALSSPDLEQATSQERNKDWQRRKLTPKRRRTVERLLPRIRRRIVRSQPGFVGRAVDGRDEEELRAERDRLGPWRVPVKLAHDLQTIEGMRGAVAEHRLLFRRDLINGTLCDLLGDDLSSTEVLDVGCQAGFFSLDLAERGAAAVQGLDLRESNLAQATFLAEHFGVDRVAFDQADLEEPVVDRQWDVVLNLGLLYHVTRPLDLLRATYEMTRRVAVIDTDCSTEPVSAFMLLSEKDVSKSDEGRDVVELHPTYRALIDGLRYAGFRHLVEVEGIDDPALEPYSVGQRRCILAFP